MLLGLLGLVVITAYSSIGRPLWIDEFAHFALGGLPPGEAAVAIVATTGPSLNQGHTGVYLFVDYWLMQAFGANLLALRLPSILSGVVLLASAAAFMRLKGYRVGWQAVAIIVFGANASLMYYTGEARPYMPLAASCLATLVYYQYPLDARHGWGARTFGVVGILAGAVSHPYYALFGTLIAAFSLWERGYLSRARRDLRRMVEFLNPWFVLPAIFLFIVVGALSWAKGRSDNPLDPWFWFGSARSAIESVASAHLEHIQPLGLPSAAVGAGLALVILTLLWAVGRAVVLPPLMLIAVGLVSSVIILLLSVMGDYWVFLRQSVGGMAIVTLGWVWLLAAVWEAPGARRWIRGFVIALVGLAAVTGAVRVSEQLSRIPDQLALWDSIDDTSRRVLDIPARERTNDEWIELGNWNVATGGPVWPEISEYYLQWKKVR